MLALWYSSMAMENLRFIDDFLYFPIQMPVEFKFGDFPASHGADDSGGYPTRRPRYMTKLSIKREVGLFHRQAFGAANRKSWYVQFHQLQDFNIGLLGMMIYDDPYPLIFLWGWAAARVEVFSILLLPLLYTQMLLGKAGKADVPLFPVGCFNIKVVETYCETWCFPGFPMKQMWISW